MSMKIYGKYNILAYIFCDVMERLTHGGSGTYRGHPPLMNQGLLIQFFDFLIAEVFLHEIYRAAKI